MIDRNTSPAKSNMKSQTVVHEIDEATPLFPEYPVSYQTLDAEPCDPELGPDNESNDANEVEKVRSPMTTISVLLIGVFVSQADTSLVLATYGKISSEFGNLESGSWLLSSYMLAMCVSQPLFGKLSNIYGRKLCLQAAYLLFAIGTAGSGLGQSMGQIIAARAVQGAGGAGMVCMVSILLTDLLPFHEVALYRSYVNIVQTLGRSCGGVFGGFLASTIGWRWAFLVQLPPTVLSIFLVQWKLKVPQNKSNDARQYSAGEKLRRIDFVGAFFLSLTIFTALFVLDTGGQMYAWKHPIIIASLCTAVVGGVVFCLVEKFYAKEPIFPIQLLTRYEVVTSYVILVLQNFSQTALMFMVPIYFQVTNNASTGEAGALLVPAVLGNAIGGLLTGAWVKRTGGYKLPTALAGASSALAFALLILLWQGHTSVWGSLLIFPGGLAVGMSHSAVFVGLTSSVEEDEVAIAGSGMYLSGSVGAVTGVSGASAAFQIALQSNLAKALAGKEDGEKILRKALSDINYIQHAGRELQQLLVPSYVSATQRIFLLCLVASILAFLVGSITREQNLLRRK